MNISWIHWIWITILVVIILLHHFPIREGMSSKCEDVSTTKNAGNIEYLQNAVSKLQETMNKLQVDDNKHEASIDTLNNKVSKMNEQLTKDTKLSEQNQTSLKQISAELQDRIKTHNQRGEQLSKP